MATEAEKRTGLYANDKLFFKNFRGGYITAEYFWRDHQSWLQEQGYMLRPRYHPDWKASWAGTKKDDEDFEDGLVPMRLVIMDAIRISDGRVVVLKKVNKAVHPYEVEIGKLFSAEPLASDCRNHSVPIYDVLQSPLDESTVFLVMPYLMRHHELRFETIGEAVECFRQLFEGLEFIHSQHVAHRDIMVFNVMLDLAPLYSETPHPVNRGRSYDFQRRVRRFTRTERPVKYYYIDFGISRIYASDDTSPLEDIIVGGDKSVPEFEGTDEPQNPFWTDIYYLGNLIRTGFLERAYGFEFMQPLINDMVQKDPSKRPTVGQARSRFEELRGSLSERKLRSRVVYGDEFAVTGLFRSLKHYFRARKHAWQGTSALPTP
ncbi:kinase-like domain-containing protein [Ganoderma leucocontextum]|nr:kinase-like domain-containing protein [Ganoderma leucocontextum]